MARLRKNKKTKMIVIILVVVLIALIFAMILLYRNTKNNSNLSTSEKAEIEHLEEVKKERAVQLSDKTEQERMQAYCADFFKLVDNGSYERAYSLLYSDYKENFFPTLNNFKKYFEDYFPSSFALDYNNIERLGDIYVLMVSVKDTVNGSYGHNFDMYVVLQEKALNDYVISFSRNSAVKEEN